MYKLSICNVLRVTFFHQHIININPLTRQCLQPDFTNITAVFSFVVFLGLNEDFLAFNLLAQKIAGYNTLLPLIAAQFGCVNPGQTDLFIVDSGMQA
jgi:hypothetical protein